MDPHRAIFLCKLYRSKMDGGWTVLARIHIERYPGSYTDPRMTVKTSIHKERHSGVSDANPRRTVKTWIHIEQCSRLLGMKRPGRIMRGLHRLHASNLNVSARRPGGVCCSFPGAPRIHQTFSVPSLAQRL